MGERLNVAKTYKKYDPKCRLAVSKDNDDDEVACDQTKVASGHYSGILVSRQDAKFTKPHGYMLSKTDKCSVISSGTDADKAACTAVTEKVACENVKQQANVNQAACTWKTKGNFEFSIMMEQVFGNLAMDAFQFGVDGGSPTVSKGPPSLFQIV